MLSIVSVNCLTSSCSHPSAIKLNLYSYFYDIRYFQVKEVQSYFELVILTITSVMTRHDRLEVLFNYHSSFFENKIA